LIDQNSSAILKIATLKVCLSSTNSEVTALQSILDDTTTLNEFVAPGQTDDFCALSEQPSIASADSLTLASDLAWLRIKGVASNGTSFVQDFGVKNAGVGELTYSGKDWIGFSGIWPSIQPIYQVCSASTSTSNDTSAAPVLEDPVLNPSDPGSN
jgi:hypothetical protein